MIDVDKGLIKTIIIAVAAYVVGIFLLVAYGIQPDSIYIPDRKNDTVLKYFKAWSGWDPARVDHMFFKNGITFICDKDLTLWAETRITGHDMHWLKEGQCESMIMMPPGLFKWDKSWEY